MITWEQIRGWQRACEDVDAAAAAPVALKAGDLYELCNLGLAKILGEQFADVQWPHLIFEGYDYQDVAGEFRQLSPRVNVGVRFLGDSVVVSMEGPDARPHLVYLVVTPQRFLESITESLAPAGEVSKSHPVLSNDERAELKV